MFCLGSGKHTLRHSPLTIVDTPHRLSYAKGAVLQTHITPLQCTNLSDTHPRAKRKQYPDIARSRLHYHILHEFSLVNERKHRQFSPLLSRRISQLPVFALAKVQARTISDDGAQNGDNIPNSLLRHSRPHLVYNEFLHLCFVNLNHRSKAWDKMSAQRQTIGADCRILYNGLFSFRPTMGKLPERLLHDVHILRITIGHRPSKYVQKSRKRAQRFPFERL